MAELVRSEWLSGNSDAGKVLHSYACGSASSENSPLLCGPMRVYTPEVVLFVGSSWCRRQQSLTPQVMVGVALSGC